MDQRGTENTDPQATYFPHGSPPRTQRPHHRTPSDGHHRRSYSHPHDMNGPQNSHGPSSYDLASHQDVDSSPENPVDGPPGSAIEPLIPWPNISYGPGGNYSSFGLVGGPNPPGSRNHDIHGSSYQYGPHNSQPAGHQQSPRAQNLPGSRRSTLRQQDYSDALFARNNPPTTLLSYDTPSDVLVGQAPPLPGSHHSEAHRIAAYDTNQAGHPRTLAQYLQHTNRAPHGQPLNYLPELYHPHYGLPRSTGNSSFPSTGVGGSGHPRLSPDTSRSRDIYSHSGRFPPPRESSPVSPSASSFFPRHNSLDREGLAASTPTPTEGSGDLESDQDVEPGASTSTSTSTSPISPSTSSPTTSRWARFHVPPNVFAKPGEEVRHELYHRIRREEWFLKQTQERSITNAESARIPGTIPGESVLLAFYDREVDDGNKPVMRCTVCKHTNQPAQLYPRPDRARDHMRHHFELRPVLCNGKCTVPHCKQRFFTTGDLNAHIHGKTEPLANCPHCNKPLKPKNLQRHIDRFCHHAPPDILQKREGY